MTKNHDPACTGCEHDCPHKGNPIGSPFCDICDDHHEARGDESEKPSPTARKKLIITYGEANAPAVPDWFAETFVLSCAAAGGKWNVSTANVITAARVLLKEGKIDVDLEFHFKEEILIPDANGRLNSWPEGFCDQEEKWLMRLLKE